MITFKIIRYKNFLSAGAAFTEIKLADTSNTLIIGENGAGKSTFLDALTFVLFGKAFRRINKPQLVNSVNEKNCLVEIEFSIGNKEYKVSRGIKPNVFEIWCDGVFLNQDSASKDYQEYLEKFILKMNYKSFTQIIILGSASFTPFMKLTPADRRMVIEDLLDIQVFSVMNTIAKTRLQVNKDLLEKNRIQSIGKEEKRDYIEKAIKTLKTSNQERIDELGATIKIHEQTIETLKNTVAIKEAERQTLIENFADLSSLKKKHDKILVLSTRIESNKQRYKTEYDFFMDNDNCPTCHQTINVTFKSIETGKLKSKIQELENGIIQIQQQKNDCIAEISRLEGYAHDAAELQKEILVIESEIKSHQKQINDLKSEIDKLEKADTVLETSQKELAVVIADIDRIETEKKDLLEEKLLIETAINLLKDGGIKTKIIKQYLPVINQQINKYLLQMGFFVNFNLNENFEETIKSRYRDTFSYENFSQGEKQRIDLALLFTWRAIAKMRNSVNANLLIFDEILDGSLDTTGTDEFLKIMWNLTSDTNTFVISHKTDTLVDKFKKVLVFTKKQNFSVVTSK